MAVDIATVYDDEIVCPAKHEQLVTDKEALVARMIETVGQFLGCPLRVLIVTVEQVGPGNRDLADLAFAKRGCQRSLRSW